MSVRPMNAPVASESHSMFGISRPAEMGLHTVRVAQMALHSTNPNPLVEGPTLVLAPVHGKVRRAGYRKAALS
jgi:hypothetical protein